MTDSPQKILQKKLPVWPTIREAFGFAWHQRRVLWGWIIIGAILTALGDLVKEFSYGEEGWGLTGFPYFAAILLTPIPGLLVFVLLAVYCHCTFLIYREENNHQIRFFFTGRERKFFAWIFGIPFCVALVIIPVILVVGTILYQLSEGHLDVFSENDFFMALVFILGFLFLFYYIFGRWILVFPAIAVDQEPSLGWSWKQTKGNSWRMFILVGSLPLTVGYLWYLLSFIGLSEFPVFSSFVTSFALFLFTPVEVAVISIAFRELTNWTPSSRAPQST